MKNILFKVAGMLGKSIRWIGAGVLLFVILVQISLWFGLQWLNSDKGEVWTKEQIEIALKDTDYTVDYSGFRYRPLTSLNVKSLKLSNSEGLIFSAENTKVGVDILPLAMRDLSLNFVSDNVVLHRLPEPEESDVEKPTNFYLPEISLPNLYFDKFNISKIAINDLEISEAVAERKINLSPLLKGDIGISEESIIDFDLRFYADFSEISNIIYLPAMTDIKGSFNAATSLFKLDKLLIDGSGVYEVKSQGSALLREGGGIDLSLGIVSDDLSKISSTINGNFKSDIEISGTQDKLVLDAEGAVKMPTLEARGLAPVMFSVQSNYVGAQGLRPATVKVSSSYKDIPIELKTLIEQQGDLILAKDIFGTAPDVKVDGNISYNLDDGIAIGKLSADMQKLSTYKDLLQLDIAGKLKANVDLSKSELGQQAVVNLDGSNVQYDTVNLRSAKVSATFPTVENYWPTSANWTLEKLTVQGATLNKMSGTIKQKEGDVYVLNTKGAGAYQMPFSFDAKADLIGLKVNTPKAQNIDASIKYNGQPIKLSGRVNANDIDMLIKTSSLSLDQFSDSLPIALQNTKLTGEAEISGLMASPVIESDISLSAFSLTKKTPAIKIDMSAGYQDKLAQINLNGSGKGIKVLSANVQTPVTLSLNPFVFDLPASQNLDGQAQLSLETESLANMLLPPQYDFSGELVSNVDIGGTAKNPQATGDFRLSSGAFADENLGLFLNDMNASGRLSNDRLELSSFTAKDNKDGNITASGYVGLEAFSPQDVQVNLDITNFHLLDGELADGKISADLELSGNPSQYNLSGSVRPDYIDISIPERLTTNIPELNIVEEETNGPAETMAGKIALNINFIADNKIFVRGWGLDAEFGGKVKIDGNLNDPNFDGVLKSSRGRYTEFGKRFELTRAHLNFAGHIPANPVMDIIAETEVEDITAQVNIQRTIQDPKVSFSSNPLLPEDEVLARILFGRDISSISPFQAVQLTQTIRRFSGKGSGSDPLGQIRDTTGLDDLRIDTDEEGETTVGAGKYIADKVYLEFEKGSGENSGAANLEVEITPNITMESEVGQDAQAGAGLFWEWDY